MEEHEKHGSGAEFQHTGDRGGEGKSFYTSRYGLRVLFTCGFFGGFFFCGRIILVYD